MRLQMFRIKDTPIGLQSFIAFRKFGIDRRRSRDATADGTRQQVQEKTATPGRDGLAKTRQDGTVKPGRDKTAETRRRGVDKGAEQGRVSFTVARPDV